MSLEHRTTREGDEYVCTCGLRWEVGEEDPHSEQPKPSGQEIIEQLKMELSSDA